MSHELSPASEAYLNELVEQQAFPDRTAALNEAVELLRRRQKVISQVNAGIDELESGRGIEFENLDQLWSEIDKRADKSSQPG